jgi:hypothetical protein
LPFPLPQSWNLPKQVLFYFTLSKSLRLVSTVKKFSTVYKKLSWQLRNFNPDWEILIWSQLHLPVLKVSIKIMIYWDISKLLFFCNLSRFLSLKPFKKSQWCWEFLTNLDKSSEYWLVSTISTVWMKISNQSSLNKKVLTEMA